MGGTRTQRADVYWLLLVRFDSVLAESRPSVAHEHAQRDMHAPQEQRGADKIFAHHIVDHNPEGT